MVVKTSVVHCHRCGPGMEGGEREQAADLRLPTMDLFKSLHATPPTTLALQSLHPSTVGLVMKGTTS